MKYLITIGLVLLMAGVGWGEERASGFTIRTGDVYVPEDCTDSDSDDANTIPIRSFTSYPDATITVDDGTFSAEDFPTIGMEWEVIMPEDCADCIEVRNGEVVVRIWPDGTVKRLKTYFYILEGDYEGIDFIDNGTYGMVESK